MSKKLSRWIRRAREKSRIIDYWNSEKEPTFEFTRQSIHWQCVYTYLKFSKRSRCKKNFQTTEKRHSIGHAEVIVVQRNRYLSTVLYKIRTKSLTHITIITWYIDNTHTSCTLHTPESFQLFQWIRRLLWSSRENLLEFVFVSFIYVEYSFGNVFLYLIARTLIEMNTIMLSFRGYLETSNLKFLIKWWFRVCHVFSLFWFSTAIVVRLFFSFFFLFFFVLKHQYI